jgi:hypothetical protein
LEKGFLATGTFKEDGTPTLEGLKSGKPLLVTLFDATSHELVAQSFPSIEQNLVLHLSRHFERFKLHKNNGVGKLYAMKRWHILVIGTAVLAAAAYFYLHGGLGFTRRVESVDGVGGTSGLGGSHPARMSWQMAVRPDAGFSVEMPAAPKDLQVPAYNEAGSTEPVKMIFASPDGDTTFAVGWEDNPPVARVNNRVPDRTLDAARDGMLSRTQTVLDNDTHASAGGYPARDVAAHNAGGGVLNVRMIYTGERLYTLMALFPSREARREQDVIRFYNSFAPSRQPGETLPAALPRG